MKRKLTTVLSIMAVVVGLASVSSAAALEKAEGEVVMIDPATIHINVDGTITEFDRTPESQVEDNLSNGDQAIIWYRTSGDTKTVARALLKGQEIEHDQMEPITTRERADTGQQQQSEQTTSQQEQQQPYGSRTDEARQQQAERTQREQGAEQREQAQRSQDDDTLTYEEYQRQSQEKMQERAMLPQTASNVHGLALAGLLLIATGAAFGFRAFRS